MVATYRDVQQKIQKKIIYFKLTKKRKTLFFVSYFFELFLNFNSRGKI